MKQHMIAALLLSTSFFPAHAEDFGQKVDAMLAASSAELFGVAKPLGASASESAEEGYRIPTSVEADSVALADGLSATFVTRDAANHLDMMAFFPAENPTHIIACIESDPEEIAPGKLNPGVQRISLADGKVETLVRGTSSCDGIRTTPWGTVLFTEEDDRGGAYEMLDPLGMTEVVIKNRETGETSDPSKVVRRMALPTMAWEGFTILPSGIVYGGDELRPGSDDKLDADGGSMFKFVPTTAHTGGNITSLDASPFAAGKVYAMQVSCLGDKLQYGQGCEIGSANWIEVGAANARADADAMGATGYYRPEDLHADPAYAGEGVRFCFTNTGNEGGSNFAEVLCVVDTKPTELPVADAEGKIGFFTTVTRFVEGDSDFNQFDNLDFQPGTGNLAVIEDHPNGDIFLCLPDGADRNDKTDGCIRVLSVKDTSAEPTGFIFAPDGQSAYLSIQHSDDTAIPMIDDYGTDDLLLITGFKPVAN
jgi:secreted PhoX family phosphatase